MGTAARSCFYSPYIPVSRCHPQVAAHPASGLRREIRNLGNLVTFGTSRCVFTLTGSFLPRQEKGEISRDNSISFDWDRVVLWHLKSCVRRGTSPVASTSSRSLWRVTQPHSPADVGGEDGVTSPPLNQLPGPEPSASSSEVQLPAACLVHQQLQEAQDSHARGRRELSET